MILTINSPLDMHLHVRDNDMLKTVAPLSAKSFAGAVIMPNLVPPVVSFESLLDYRKRVLDAVGDEKFTPYMTLFFKNSYNYEFLQKVKEHLIGIKLYPSGITTNSQDGVKSMDIEELRDTLEAMSELNIPLLVHGESDGFVMDREKEFGETYIKLATEFPNLKIIMEHITTKESVSLLDKFENLFATITLHHLYITLDDVAGGMLKPHLFCKPIAKRPQDREALLNVALNAHSKVMFGSDSAPHPISAKESCGCAAGVFTAPIALQALAQLFEKHSKLDNLQKFVSDNAVNIYGINPPVKKVILEKENFLVPDSYADVIPMFASSSLEWRIKSVV